MILVGGGMGRLQINFCNKKQIALDISAINIFLESARGNSGAMFNYC